MYHWRGGGGGEMPIHIYLAVLYFRSKNPKNQDLSYGMDLYFVVFRKKNTVL